MQEETLQEIYVALLNEGTDVWRPVIAIAMGKQGYRIISENTRPGIENWEYITGEIVHCQEKKIGSGSIVLAATDRA